jgi:hypothetical protein
MRALLVVSVAALAACATNSSDEPAETGVSDMVGDWSADLSARNGSGITGDAGAQSALAATGATISIRGAAASAQHPWHIHRGTCSAGGPVVGEASAYPVLTPARDGTARAAATIGVPLNENESYHVNVHRSPQEMGVVVACGDLRN